LACSPYVIDTFFFAAQVLKLLNSNSETPYLMWDNGTRAEVMDYLEQQQESCVKRGECDQDFGASFVFTAHSTELIVSDIYVRIFNEQVFFLFTSFICPLPLSNCTALF
jgi:DnaJ family protein C protein 13